MSPEEYKKLVKEAQKEALKEWLDDIWIKAGKWSMGGIFALFVTIIIHLWLALHDVAATAHIVDAAKEISK